MYIHAVIYITLQYSFSYCNQHVIKITVLALHAKVEYNIRSLASAS